MLFRLISYERGVGVDYLEKQSIENIHLMCGGIENRRRQD